MIFYHILNVEDEITCQYNKGDRESLLVRNGKRYNILITHRADMWQCEVGGYPVMLESETGGYIKSPSPAIVLSVNTSVGKKVKQGDVLVVLEAMKMEMLVESPGEGIVKEINISSGTQVAAGQALILLDLNKEITSRKIRVNRSFLLMCRNKVMRKSGIY